MKPAEWLDGLASYMTRRLTAPQSFISRQAEIINSVRMPASFSEIAPRLVVAMANG